MNKAFKIVAVNVLVFIGLLLMLEASLQVIALIRPSYDVLFLQPDKVLGWKQVPNLRWTWTGHYWFASDFTVSVETDPLGFRDVARGFPRCTACDVWRFSGIPSLKLFRSLLRGPADSAWNVP
jgi:hypothetical protein